MRASLCCWGPRRPPTGPPLFGGRPGTGEAGGSGRGRRRGCSPPAGEWRRRAPGEGWPAGQECRPTRQRGARAPTGPRSAGRTSPNRFRCPVGDWECWERSCGCLDLYLWCHCCRPPGCFGSLKSSPPPPRLLPRTGSPADPGGSRNINTSF